MWHFPQLPLGQSIKKNMLRVPTSITHVVLDTPGGKPALSRNVNSPDGLYTPQFSKRATN